jgi:predicted nucleic acid-binding protein
VSAPEVSYFLDTSALLTLLEDEEGADRVEHVLRRAKALISAVSLVEVRYVTLRERGAAEADVRHALIKRSGAEIVWELDEPTVLRAASFKSELSLSLADALIAACAHRHAAVLLHKDPEFEALAGQLQLEGLPYKHLGKRG